MDKYDAYKDSGIEWVGKIPASWSTIPNKRIMTKKKDICEKWNGEDVMSLTMNGVIVRDLINPTGKMPATFDGYQYVHDGDLLMCLFDIDVTPRCVGRVFHDGVTSPAYSRFTLVDYADLGYYYYYYLMMDNTKELLHLAKNLRHSFTEEQLGSLLVPLPPMDEQKTIAAYLDLRCSEIDATIDVAKGCIDDYRLWRASTILELVTKGMQEHSSWKETGINWADKIPSTWELLPLKRVVIARNGGAWGEEPQHDDFDRICMRVADFDFDNGKFKHVDRAAYTMRNYDEIKIKRLSLQKGDILVEKSGGGEKTPVGRAVMYDLDELALFANFMDRLTVDTELVLPEFFEYFWQAMYYQAITTIYIKQTTGIQNLNLSTLLEKEFIFIPSKSEQHVIVEELDRFSKHVHEIIQDKVDLIDDLEKYKKSIIYEAVTGKRKVVQK